MDAWQVARLVVTVDRGIGMGHVELELADLAGEVYAWRLFSVSGADFGGWNLHDLVSTALRY